VGGDQLLRNPCIVQRDELPDKIDADARQADIITVGAGFKLVRQERSYVDHGLCEIFEICFIFSDPLRE
jgi:hypothetical protein